MLLLDVDEAHLAEDLGQRRGEVELPAVLSRKGAVVYEVVEALDGMVDCGRAVFPGKGYEEIMTLEPAARFQGPISTRSATVLVPVLVLVLQGSVKKGKKE